MSVINCGHNPPLIKRENGKYEFLKIVSNLPLGIFKDVDFELYNIEMAPGDIIYTYTDGVTEATNTDNEIFGEGRLHTCLNNIRETNPKIITEKVKSKLEEYTNSAPQSDDITMLSFKYIGSKYAKTFKQEAKIENYKELYSWIHKACDEWKIGAELANKLDMCGEEIFANISFYAYPEGVNSEETIGMVEAQLKLSDNLLTLEFKDSGIEYNPLEKPDPDITLPPEERPLGGLGIFMTKKMADDISYKRENGCNILTLTFKV